MAICMLRSKGNRPTITCKADVPSCKLLSQVRWPFVTIQIISDQHASDSAPMREPHTEQWARMQPRQAFSRNYIRVPV